MTPEQLEAHRVRFEQRYAEKHGRSVSATSGCWDETYGCYSPESLQDAWRGYQLALADADRAQRAAPGVQAYATGHCAEKAKPGGCQLHNLQCGYPKCDQKPATLPPQQSAQPVAWMHETPGRVDVIHDEVKKLLSAVATDYLYRPIDKSEKYTIPLYAAAQPVEVHRVPLTADEVWSNNDLMALNAELGLTLDQFMELVGVITAALGIKHRQDVNQHGLPITSNPRT